MAVKRRLLKQPGINSSLLVLFLDNIKINLLFSISGYTLAYTGRTYVSKTIYSPKIVRSTFLIFSYGEFGDMYVFPCES